MNHKFEHCEQKWWILQEGGGITFDWWSDVLIKLTALSSVLEIRDLNSVMQDITSWMYVYTHLSLQQAVGIKIS